MKANTTQPRDDTSRRRLITGAIYGIPLLICGTLTASAGSYLLRNRRAQSDDWADAGDIAGLQSGTPREVRFERAVVDGWNIRKEQASAWVILDERRHLTAFSPACTHLGCAYRWQADKKAFACPCHGSAFNLRGDVIAGPANRPLDRYPIKVEGSRLWLGPLQDETGA